jgi:hypothetical protein
MSLNQDFSKELTIIDQNSENFDQFKRLGVGNKGTTAEKKE